MSSATDAWTKIRFFMRVKLNVYLWVFFICQEGLLHLIDSIFIHSSRRSREFVRISLKNAEVEGVWGVDSCWVLAVSTKLVKIEAGVEVVVAGLALSSNSDPEMDAGVVGTSVQHTHDSHGHTYSNPNDVVSLVNTAFSIVITVPSICTIDTNFRCRK